MKFPFRFRRKDTSNKSEEKTKSFFPQTNDTSIQKKEDAFFQAKLKIGQPGDPYEQEADVMADHVVNNLSAGQTVQKMEATGIRRYMTNPEDELGTNTQRIEKDKEIQEKPVQMQPDPTSLKLRRAEKEEEPVQMQAGKEEEEPVQMKAAAEEEEPVQMQADPTSLKLRRAEKEEEPVQMQAVKEEEEPVQMKAAAEEEEPVQMQSDPTSLKLRRAEKEEEPVQMQAGKEEEEPVQMKTNGQKNGKKKLLTVEELLARSKGQGIPLPEDVRAAMESQFKSDFSEVRIHTGEDAVTMTQLLKAHAFTQGCDIYFNEGKYQPFTAGGQELLAHELTHVVQQNQAK